jgi:hypothetical protein
MPTNLTKRKLICNLFHKNITITFEKLKPKLMIEKTVQIEATPDNVAELLFNLDDRQVAEVFSLWHKKFEDEYERRKEAKEPIWIFDLPHFWMHVSKHLDDNGKTIIRDLYAMQFYTHCNEPYRRYLIQLH